MVSNTTFCLSGRQPILLTSDVCNPGFYCPNNSAENPPQYCPPTPECQIQRLQIGNNTCGQPQGNYEPIICSSGYYCPHGGLQQKRCPRGHYCPQGSVKPFKCLPLSICPPGSMNQRHLVGVLSCVLLDVLLFCLWLWQHKSKKGREDMEMTLVHHTGDYTSGIGSVLMGESAQLAGLDIKFNDISYRVKGSCKHILTGISGSAQKGSMIGIMGPSGSGKSTLVNILCGKLRATSGSISVQGVEMSVSNLNKYKDLIGYVPQDDVVHPYLTVRENLLFSGRIRLGGVLNDKEIQRNVDQLIQALGLTNVKDSLVGDQERRGVSGGERKRISIGLELIAAPRVLILDEPTSGLDAQAALSVIKLLKTLSGHGITIVCVLHQPRLEIFGLLDTLLLLRSGKQIYFGQRSEAEQYFKDIGYGFDPQLNPADTILDIVGGSPLFSSSLPSENVGNKKLFSESLETSQPSNENVKSNLEQIMTLHDLYRKQTSPWYWQLYLCFCRDLKHQSRNRGPFMLEVFGGILTGLVMGLAIFEHNGHLYQGLFLPPFQLLSSAINYALVQQVGILSLFAISFASAAPSVSIFSVETLLFHREYHSGHSGSAYFVGKVLTSFLRSFLCAIHFTTCFMILATPVISFGTLLGLNLLYFYCIYGVGSIVAALTKRENGPLVCLLVTIVMGMFSGYAPRLAKVQEWHLAWFWYLSPGTWFTEAFFTGNTWQFSYLYDRAGGDAFTGYTTGRTGFDISLMLLLGTVYRVIGCSLMIMRARGSWRRLFK